jgi:hypothetical protein
MAENRHFYQLSTATLHLDGNSEFQPFLKCFILLGKMLAEVGELRLQGKPGLHKEFQGSLAAYQDKGRKEGSKEGRKEGRKQGRKEVREGGR